MDDDSSYQKMEIMVLYLLRARRVWRAVKISDYPVLATFYKATTEPTYGFPSADFTSAFNLSTFYNFTTFEDLRSSPTWLHQLRMVMPLRC
jgi:hypothetical protein